MESIWVSFPLASWVLKSSWFNFAPRDKRTLPAIPNTIGYNKRKNEKGKRLFFKNFIYVNITDDRRSNRTQIAINIYQIKIKLSIENTSIINFRNNNVNVEFIIMERVKMKINDVIHANYNTILYSLVIQIKSNLTYLLIREQDDASFLHSKDGWESDPVNDFSGKI